MRARSYTAGLRAISIIEKLGKKKVKEMSRDAKLGLYVIGVAAIATIVSMGLGLLAG